MAGNSLVNVGSVVPAPKQSQFTSKSPTKTSKPLNPSHKKSPSLSPEQRSNGEREVEAQLKQIKPRYADFVSQKPKATRPQSAFPAQASKARVASNNRDLAQVEVSKENNFTGNQASAPQKPLT